MKKVWTDNKGQNNKEDEYAYPRPQPAKVCFKETNFLFISLFIITARVEVEFLHRRSHPFNFHQAEQAIGLHHKYEYEDYVG
ncbi:MAG: hypothetical protein ACXU98_10405, partial [Syntrophales bacterium]